MEETKPEVGLGKRTVSSLDYKPGNKWPSGRVVGLLKMSCRYSTIEASLEASQKNLNSLDRLESI